ncbi:hypothetical protein [Blastomonas sp.]|uniref:hypothetical protein n=1 Tax=Blastomonas sp. TaxID=1909299 RepID=UPI002601D1BD|nr:hypothetical protein [Blastomonas sp.]MDM7955778.1 hypothetical protein [Blastomonas sp.]
MTDRCDSHAAGGIAACMMVIAGPAALLASSPIHTSGSDRAIRNAWEVPAGMDGPQGPRLHPTQMAAKAHGCGCLPPMQSKIGSAMQAR